MPGMMETVLNIGLTDAAIRQAPLDDLGFVLDAYRRLIQMYGEVVAGIDPASSLHERERVEQRQGTTLTVGALIELVNAYGDVYLAATGAGFPQDPNEQLFAAVAAVFDSWNAPRAQVYREQCGISNEAGTAANVVQMVFGNRDAHSATGVCFSRDPATGQPGLYGEFLFRAQGEDIVAGTETPEPVARMRLVLPEAYDELEAAVAKPRNALPRPPGCRVHGRKRPAVHLADAGRQENCDCGAARGGRHDRRRVAHTRRRNPTC